MKEKLIDELLTQIKSLEMSLLAIKEKEKLSFSFLNDAFNKAQKIVRQLHDLEIIQVNAMQQETEKLLMLWSEKIENQDTVYPETTDREEKETTSENSEETDTEATSYEQKNSEECVANENQAPDNKITRQDEEEEKKQSISDYAEMDTHPLFPNIKKPQNKQDEPLAEEQHKTVLNDVLAEANPPASLDLKRIISLNDRYLFQRELFNNDRHKMNNMMLKLNAFDTYDEVEAYLREHTNWNFEDDTVNDFLMALQRGFE